MLSRPVWGLFGSWRGCVAVWGAGLLGLAVGQSFGQLPTLLDPGFNSAGANDDVFALAQAGDGHFLIAGQFTAYNGVNRGRLARLATADGQLDTGFFTGTGADNSIYAVAAQADGKVLIGGAFTHVHGQTRSYLARLEANGTLDASFAAGLAINNELRSVIVEPDGHILIAGRFTQVGGQSRNRIARLNNDGSLDPAFAIGTGASDNIRSMLRLADGRILIGGQFTNYNGVERIRLARLLSNGGLDPTFIPGLGADDQVRAIATNSVGQIYIGGDFEHYNGTNRSAVARLFPDGGLDLGFDQGQSNNDAVRALAVQPDGKLWIGGLFFQAGGLYRSNLARLNPDGSADDFFDPFAVLNDEVFALDYNADQQLLVGGKFTRVDDRPARRLARLLPASQSVLFTFDADLSGHPENAGPARIGLRRRGWLAGPAAVGLVTRNGTAIAGEDFVHFTGEVLFASFQTTGAAPVTIIDDAFAEGDEWFEAELVNPPSLPFGATNQIRQIRIVDNEFPATVDESFRPDSINGPVYATAVQPDGKVVIGGAFLYRGSCLANSLGRLNTNGTVDCDFTVHSVGANGPVYSIALQTNGQIVVGGQFTYFSSQPSTYLARVQPNGFGDPTFMAGTNLNGAVFTTAVLPDGRILVGGLFTAYGTTPRSYLARLNADGSLDPAFNPVLSPNGFVRTIRLTSEGRIWIAGDFTQINGAPRPRVARLEASGALDPTFTPGAGPDGPVLALAEQVDGRIVIAGLFSTVDGLSRTRLARLKSTGFLDTSFAPGGIGGPSVNTVAVQADGKVVFGGVFNLVGPAVRPFIARVQSNGALDTSFFPSSGANGEVNSALILPGGEILVSGNFTSIGGLPRLFVARLAPDSTTNGIEMAVGSLTTNESAGSVSIEVRRTGQSAGLVSADYTTVADTALPGTDYVSRSGRLTFAPLETVHVIEIPILNDGLPESLERFRVRLSNPLGAAILNAPAETSIEIADNDAGLEVEASLPIVREGLQREIEFVVHRNSDGPESIQVDFATADITAVAGSDFIATNGTLTFLPGEFEHRVTVTVLDNPEFEGRESFGFVLSNASPGAGLGAKRAALVLIEDQDSSFHFESIHGSTEDGGMGLAHVYRRGLATQPATVRVRTDGGTATPGLDYVPVDLILTFAPGEGIRHFYVTNLNDGLVEPTETIRLVLSEPTGLSIIEEPSEASLPIDDNDRGIEFLTPTFHANEFSARARAVVRRGDDGTNTLTVQFSTSNQGALAGSDYVAQSGTLVLPPGETNATILVPLLQDSLLETNEDIGLVLSQPSATASLGTQSVARIVILDDERAGSLDLAFHANPDDLGPWGAYGGPVRLSAHSGHQLLVGAQLGLARLGSDGRGDTNFTADPYEFAMAVALQRRDGKILVGVTSSNDFSSSGSECLRLLETNGTTDSSFAFPIVTGRTTAIAQQDDGRVVIGGAFVRFPGEFDERAVLRVLPTGAIDPTFDAGTFSPANWFFFGPITVEAIALQPDGKILAAGMFETVAGQNHEKIVRLNPSGTIDPTFQSPPVTAVPPTATAYFGAMVLQPDGAIVVGGSFTNIGGVTANNLARLNPDGTLDLSFVSPLEPYQSVAAIGRQPDGKLLIAGWGYDLSTGTAKSFIHRLLSSGAVDSSFDAGLPPDGSISSLLVLPGGDIAIGGGFSQVNGIARPLVARLKGDGLRLAIRPSGRDARLLQLFNTWPGGVTVVEASADLVHWEPIGAQIAAGTSQEWILPGTEATMFFRARHSAP